MSEDVLSRYKSELQVLHEFVASLSPYHQLATIDGTHYDIMTHSVASFRLIRYWAMENDYRTITMMPICFDDSDEGPIHFYGERVFDDGSILSLRLDFKLNAEE